MVKLSVKECFVVNSDTTQALRSAKAWRFTADWRSFERKCQAPSSTLELSDSQFGLEIGKQELPTSL